MAVSELTLFLGITLFLVAGLIIWKKPEVIKKNKKKPLTFKNIDFKSALIGDWKQFLKWIFIMLMIWSYAHDTAACRELMSNVDEVCLDYMNQKSEIWFNEDYVDMVTVINYNGSNKTWGDYQPSSSDIVPPNS